MPERVGGILVGKKGSPIPPVIELLKGCGITVHNDTVGALRSGKTPGTRIEHQIHAAETLISDDSSTKDDNYLSIARSGERMRRTGKGFRKNCFISDHYTEDIAEEVSLDTQQVRKAIRAMRAEIVFEPDSLKVYQQIFDVVVGRFLSDMSKIFPSQQPALLRRIESSWNGDIAEFYRKLYRESGVRSIGHWTAYEMPFLRYFYQSRIAGGSFLSGFDHLVLTSTFSEESIANVVNACRTKTGVYVDEAIIDQHRSLLLYGKPTTPFWSR